MGASSFLKSILNICSQKKDVNVSTPEYECPLLTKSGFVSVWHCQVIIWGKGQECEDWSPHLDELWY